MRQRFFLFLLLFLSLSLTGCQKQIIKTEVTIGGTTIKAEIADTDALRIQGLSGRESLAENSGMLFLWPKADYYAIWMKGMKFPIDIIWINGNQVVDFVESAEVPSNSNLSSIPTYSPKQKADKVLEVNAGFIQVNKVQIGDKINIQ